MEDLMIKKAEAIHEVKFKLSLYAEIMTNGFLPIVDRVPSFTSSILTMPQSNGIGKGLGEKVTQAITEELNDNSFLKEYSSIISSLQEAQQEIIFARYFKNMKFAELEQGNEKKPGDKRIYKKLNDIYLIIACLDGNIDFTFDNYVNVKMEERKELNENNERKKIKSQVLNRVRLLLFNNFTNHEGALDKEIFEKISKKYRDTLVQYIYKKKTFDSKDYRQINVAIYIFAYLHPDITMSHELFLTSLKKERYKEAISIADGQVEFLKQYNDSG